MKLDTIIKFILYILYIVMAIGIVIIADVSAAAGLTILFSVALAIYYASNEYIKL
jgi:hypothetical protein